MHIMEGFLPQAHALGWWAAALPFMIIGSRSISKTVRDNPSTRLLLAAAGAFIFVLSALKLPSVTGSCSHPTGTGLSAILYGPSVTCVLGTIVLFFQALLLAHGGLTTLGANAFSMAIAGPWLAFAVYHLLRRCKASLSVAVFSAAMLGDLLTYVVTSFQLAAAFPDAVGGFASSLAKFLTIFAFTQLPLAIAEGLLTVLIMNALTTYSPDELTQLNILNQKENPS